MLSFFRKYQKFFFLFITIIIVVSFVFFGTYQTFAPSSTVKEETAFVAIDGKKISQSYLQNMSHFLATEPLSMRGFQNFLNDSFISREFLDTKISSLLIKENREKIQEELLVRKRKEQSFRPYSHPVIPQLSAENTWAVFAPPLNRAFHDHLGVHESEDAFSSRVALFLAERRFPSEILSYILRYQEKEFSEIPKDTRLTSDSLALFGYKDLQDWFGPTFIENAAKAVIQGAAFARVQGYRVSKEEIAADILYKRERAFQRGRESSWPNSYALYQDCLKMQQIDEPRAFSILEDILLFRRLFQDATSLNLVDTFALKSFYEKAHECAEVEFVQLPEELNFKKLEDLEKFEVYLDVVSSRREHPLALPSQLDPIEEIAGRAKELIASNFVVEWAHVSKRELEAKVSVKETWDWQAKNAQILQERFPSIVSLDSLDSEKRAELDSFARARIVATHPEWIGVAMDAKEKQERTLSLPKEKLTGIFDLPELCLLLERGDLLSSYTQDEENYYFFKVKERLPKVVLTFKEALESRGLDEIVRRVGVKDTEELFAAIFAEAKEQENFKKEFSKEALLPYRFGFYLRCVKEDSQKETSLWALVKKKESIFRYSQSLVSFDQAVSCEVSPLLLSGKEGIFFYRLVDRRVETSLPLEKMLQEQKLASDELKYTLLEKILKVADAP